MGPEAKDLLLDGIHVSAPRAEACAVDVFSGLPLGNGLFRDGGADDAVDKLDCEVAEGGAEDHAVTAVGALGQAYDEDFLKLAALVDDGAARAGDVPPEWCC